MTLWYLASTESFRQISDRFNVTLSVSYTTIRLVTEILMNKSKKYIQWPAKQKYQSISNEFCQKRRLPFIIGCIDGTHIQINRPKENQEYYYNRRGYHSILLQGVVFHNRLFTNIYCGEPGSIHDARLLKKSDLYRKASAYNEFFGIYYLLGDSTYPASLRWVVPPYK
ncbi:hypothetical protein NQ314_012763 [Rhamnusium bicolor]|uniref:DDE Tnp4 domain-containing protein n=1 Tax=Rhamnusium bicolor TaxID=1586634 RepID=A0AAV8XAL0_9CUCU|nr:hypothetical protein NQ314_012763 [Rhamnusium bicolor]